MIEIVNYHKEMLKELNDTRNRIVGPLVQFRNKNNEKKTAKEFIRKNPELEKDLVELAQNAPKGLTPLAAMMGHLEKIGFIKK